MRSIRIRILWDFWGGDGNVELMSPIGHGACPRARRRDNKSVKIINCVEVGVRGVATGIIWEEEASKVVSCLFSRVRHFRL